MIIDHDIVFFFGDLNYRINLPTDQVKSMITSEVGLQAAQIFFLQSLNLPSMYRNGMSSTNTINSTLKTTQNPH